MTMQNTYPDTVTGGRYADRAAKADAIASQWPSTFVDHIQRNSGMLTDWLDLWERIEEASNAVADQYLEGGVDDPRKQELFMAFVEFAGFKPACPLTDYMLDIAENYWVGDLTPGFSSATALALNMHTRPQWNDLAFMSDSLPVTFVGYDRAIFGEAHRRIANALSCLDELNEMTGGEWPKEPPPFHCDYVDEYELVEKHIAKGLEDCGVVMVETASLGIVAFSK